MCCVSNSSLYFTSIEDVKIFIKGRIVLDKPKNKCSFQSFNRTHKMYIKSLDSCEVDVCAFYLNIINGKLLRENHLRFYQ